MPLLKTSDTDLVRIDLPAPGEWVQVKRALGRDDERRVTAKMLSGQRIRPGEPIADFDAGAMLDAAVFATLEVAIRAWSFAEAVTPENIRALDDASVEAISTRLNDLYPGPRSDDERKNSLVNGAPPSSDGATSPASSGG